MKPVTGDRSNRESIIRRGRHFVKYFIFFSTHPLTVLITGVIVHVEQKNKTTNTLFRKGEWAYEY